MKERERERVCVCVCVCVSVCLCVCVSVSMSMSMFVVFFRLFLMLLTKCFDRSSFGTSVKTRAQYIVKCPFVAFLVSRWLSLTLGTTRSQLRPVFVWRLTKRFDLNDLGSFGYLRTGTAKAETHPPSHPASPSQKTH